MSIRTTKKTIIAGSTAAISAIGLLTAPAIAQALPMIPLAPTCSFNGTYVLNQSNGFRVEFPWNGSAPSGTAIAYGNDQQAKLTGPVNGGITSANEVAVTIDWANTPSYGQYVGKLDAGGNVRGGFNQDVGVPGNTASWDSVTPLKCVEAAAPAAPAKVDPPPKVDPPAPTVQKATVKQESDVYDAVSGNRIEEPFALAVGKQYETVQPCADNWCLLKIPELAGGAHGALPAKQGWVYAGGNGDTVFLEVG
jgi:hypothetical protein